jgi:hypothetical protein
MNRMTLPAATLTHLVLAMTAGMLAAQDNSPEEAVTRRGDELLAKRGGQWVALTNTTTLPGGIQVFTNFTFRVQEGKERPLKPGQIIRPDGYLLSPDGAITPVRDYVTMSRGAVMVFKNGEGQPITATLTLADGTGINPDGSYVRPSGRRSRLVEGQLLSLEGVPISGLDTISLRHGKAVVYKSGTLIPLSNSTVIMGMPDGTRVRGDGLITSPNGTSRQLSEGEIMAVPARRVGW